MSEMMHSTKILFFREKHGFFGDVEYYNAIIEEHKVMYPDETSDYIKKMTLPVSSAFVGKEIKRNINHHYLIFFFLNFSA